MQNLSRQENREIPDVYSEISQSGVTVIGFELPTAVALSVMDSNGRCFIGIDRSRRHSRAQERTALMHELGHCETGAFYGEDVSPLFRGKCERKADVWAIKHFLPYDKIMEAYRSGICTNFELAEYFDVSEQFIEKAVGYYLQNGEQYGT